LAKVFVLFFVSYVLKIPCAPRNYAPVANILGLTALAKSVGGLPNIRFLGGCSVVEL